MRTNEKEVSPMFATDNNSIESGRRCAAKLRALLPSVLDTMYKKEHPVGSGVSLILDDSLAEKYSLSRTARLVKTGTTFMIHASTQDINREKVYDWHFSTNVGEIQRLTQGKSFEPQPVSPSFPKRIKAKDATLSYQYEERLLRKMNERFGKIVLVNPSKSSCYAMGDRTIFYSCPDEYSGWYAELAKTEGFEMKRVALLTDHIKYLGSNGAHPGHRNYVALTPSFSSTQFPFANMEVSHETEGIRLKYEKKEIKREYLMVRYPDHYRYSPKQIDSMTGMKGEHFYMESDIWDVHTVEPDISGMPCFFFQGEAPAYVKEGEWIVSQDDKYVYDVKGPGTVMGRRHIVTKWAEERGKRLPGMSKTGTSGFNWNCSEVIKIGLGVSVAENVVSFVGNKKLVYSPPTAVAKPVIAVHSSSYGGKRINSCPGLHYSIVYADGMRLYFNRNYGQVVVVKSVAHISTVQLLMLQWFYPATSSSKLYNWIPDYQEANDIFFQQRSVGTFSGLENVLQLSVVVGDSYSSASYAAVVNRRRDSVAIFGDRPTRMLEQLARGEVVTELIQEEALSSDSRLIPFDKLNIALPAYRMDLGSLLSALYHEGMFFSSRQLAENAKALYFVFTGRQCLVTSFTDGWSVGDRIIMVNW